MEFTKEIEKFLNADAVIAQVEKNTKSVLAYVQPVAFRETLVNLTEAQVNFAKANLTALTSLQTIAKQSAEEFTKNFQKAVK
jgi:hypothetical protein